MDWAAISEALAQPLDPKHVKAAPKGKFGDYVDAYHVISEANRIFGHDGWSYTVTRMQMVSEQVVSLKGRDGEYDQARVGYMASVQVCVGGATREGCAVGSGVGNPNNLADHHEAAVKEAETDALKRALRSFGNTFGLALYDKEKSNVGTPFNATEQRNRVCFAIQKINDDETLQKFWGQASVKEIYAQLPEPMQNELTKIFGDKETQLREAA